MLTPETHANNNSAHFSWGNVSFHAADVARQSLCRRVKTSWTEYSEFQKIHRGSSAINFGNDTHTRVMAAASRLQEMFQQVSALSDGNDGPFVQVVKVKTSAKASPTPPTQTGRHFCPWELRLVETFLADDSPQLQELRLLKHKQLRTIHKCTI